MALACPILLATLVSFASTDGRFSFKVDCTEAPDLKVWAETMLKPVVETQYARLADEFACVGYRPRKEIKYVLKEHMKNPGVAHGSEVDLHISWIRKHLNNRRLGMVIHETWHLLQGYKAEAPTWLKEGIDDWVRYYFYEHDPQNVDLKTVRADAGYAKTAAFLEWCNGPDSENFVRSLIHDLRTGAYDGAAWWTRKTGLSFEDLEAAWKAGRASPSTTRDALREMMPLEQVSVKIGDLVRSLDEKGVPTCEWAELDALLDGLAYRDRQAFLTLTDEYPVAKWDADVPKRNLMAMLVRATRELAARYDDDPRLAFVEIGFEQWDAYCSKEFQKRFLLEMDKIWHATPWMTREAAKKLALTERAYDLRVTQRTSRLGKTEITIANRGKTPCLHDIRVRVGRTTSAETLKGLLPGSKRTFSFESASSDKAYLVSKKFLPGVRIRLKDDSRK